MLDVIEGRLGQVVVKDPAELFAAIYANPDDDAPRSVLADALQEAGDPRGEFIALQLARGRGGKKTRREGQLLKANARTWLGPLAQAVLNKGMVFERGFLARCQVQRHTLQTPAWATVEEVELDRYSWPESLQPLADTLPSLRALRINGHAGQLPSHPRLEKIDVGFVYEDHDHAHLAKLDLPSLREFHSSTCHATLRKLKPFLTSVGRSLRVLSLGRVSDPAAWILWCAKSKLERASVSDTMNPWVLSFAGDRITAEYRYSGHPQPRAPSQLAAWLALVPSPNTWDVTVTCSSSWSGTNVASIKRGASSALKRFASQTFTEPAT